MFSFLSDATPDY